MPGWAPSHPSFQGGNKAMLQGQAIAHGVSNETARKALFGSFFGTALEAYDFLLYGSAAGLVFNKLFFSECRSAGRDPAGFRNLRSGVYCSADRGNFHR